MASGRYSYWSAFFSANSAPLRLYPVQAFRHDSLYVRGVG